jgi:hypothetical protein
LKCGSKMIAIMLWTYFASKDLKKSKKGVITFVTSSRVFLCNYWIYVSKGLKTSKWVRQLHQLSFHVHNQGDSYCNNQWPLDWFNTHVGIGFKAYVIILVTTHTWA